MRDHHLGLSQDGNEQTIYFNPPGIDFKFPGTPLHGASQTDLNQLSWDRNKLGLPLNSFKYTTLWGKIGNSTKSQLFQLDFIFPFFWGGVILGVLNMSLLQDQSVLSPAETPRPSVLLLACGCSSKHFLTRKSGDLHAVLPAEGTHTNQLISIPIHVCYIC